MNSSPHSARSLLAASLLAVLWLASTSPLAYAAAGNGSAPEEPVLVEEPQAPDAPALRAAPIDNNVAGSYLSSQYARSSGNIDEAIVQLRRVHQRQPENISVSVQLQGMLLLQGSIEEAAMLAEDIQHVQGKDPLSDLVLALRALKHNHSNDATNILQTARDNGNVQLWVPLILGWVDQSEGRLTKPLTKEVFSADIGRASPLVNYHLALINAQAGFKDEAVQNFKGSIEDPENAPARIMDKLSHFYHANGEPKELTELIKKFEIKNGEIKGNATTEIKTATDGIAEVLYTMGGIMFGAGVVNDAAIYMQLASYIKPDFSEAQVALGDAYGELQQYDRSIEAYSHVDPASNLYMKSQLHIAVNMDRQGNLKQAIALLDKLNAQNTNDTDAIVTKGDLFRIHSRYQEAINAYTEALARITELQSDDWPILFARGSCLERLGKWQEAEKDLLAALDLKPDQPDILNYLGFAQLEHNQNIDGARQMIARAVESRPNDPQIVDSMGWVLYMQGEYDTARSYLEKAIELSPSDPTINDHLGDVYWRLSRKTEARFQWNRALSYSPESKLLNSLNQKIKDGLPPHTIAASAMHQISDADGSPDPATP